MIVKRVATQPVATLRAGVAPLYALFRDSSPFHAGEPELLQTDIGSYQAIMAVVLAS